MTKNENLIRIFEFALAQEKHGKSYFEHSLKGMEDQAAKSAILRLIEEEDKHIEIIERILKGLRDGAELEDGGEGRVKLKGRDLFDERGKGRFLEECVLDSGSADACVFKTAYMIEKDLSEFYREMADKSEGGARKAFQMLADWEQEHARFFKEYRDRLSRLYSEMY
ncbi:MAG: hypothetical protein JW821_06415 [Deltaproteobacteria bacterium]|nr:hypothetical protein [Deltaproteobacteria bacterium]